MIFSFPIYKRSPNIYFSQGGRALSPCYWTKTSEEMNMYKQRKRRKILKNCHFFKIATYSNLCKSLLNLVWEQSTRQSGGHFKSFVKAYCLLLRVPKSQQFPKLVSNRTVGFFKVTIGQKFQKKFNMYTKRYRRKISQKLHFF